MPEIRVCKTATCPSLRKKSTLTYDLGVTADNQVYIRVTENSNPKARIKKGTFSKDWYGVEKLLSYIKEKSNRFASTVWKPLFEEKDGNTAGFLLAVLREEGFVEPAKKKIEKKKSDKSKYYIWHRRTDKDIDSLRKELDCTL